jgi:uncharacterized membrane protein
MTLQARLADALIKFAGCLMGCALVFQAPAVAAQSDAVPVVPMAPAKTAAPVATAAPADLAARVASAYRLVALPFPFRPTSLNDKDQVIGTDARRRAAVWSLRSGMHELPLPAGFEISEGISINAAGRALALASDRAGTRHGAYTVFHDRITLLPGANTRGYKINEAGVVSGEAQLPGAAGTEPVLWIDGVLRPLGQCCGGAARDLNRAGQAIGDVYDASGAFQAFMWSAASGFHSVGPAVRYSNAIALNDRGHVVIQALPKVYLYDGEKLVPLAAPGKYPPHAFAINDGDVVVGGVGPFSDDYRAFAWDAAQGFIDLNSRLRADDDWTLETAVAINAGGVILGRGDHGDDEHAGFLLMPLAAP